ncbi:MAG: glycosyltransferase [Candidatus Hodarchaeota archaeon]
MLILASPAFSNWLNPYNELLYNSMARYGVLIEDYSLKSIFAIRKVFRHRFSIWHLHWPQGGLNSRLFLIAFVSTGLLLSLIKYVRLRGTKVIWTVHDLQAQEGFHPRLAKLFWQFFIPQLDGYLVLSESGKKIALRRFPSLKKIPGFVVPHGHYKDAYPNLSNKSDARKHLQIPDSAKVILFFGRLCNYKNVSQLVSTFLQISDTDTMLIVAGSPSAGSASLALAKKIMAQAKIDSRIRCFLNFIPVDEAQFYFNAADVVVLPYKQILHSGSAFLALSFNKPILVPNKGVFPELKNQMGDKWVKTYSGELTLQELRSTIDWAINTDRSECKILEELDWTIIARKTLKAYLQIVKNN